MIGTQEIGKQKRIGGRVGTTRGGVDVRAHVSSDVGSDGERWRWRLEESKGGGPFGFHVKNLSVLTGRFCPAPK
ncbi:hypothetical protein SLA2020_481640 [Shorea laevis]